MITVVSLENQAKVISPWWKIEEKTLIKKNRRRKNYFFNLFTIVFVNIIFPSNFVCTKYSYPKGFNANYDKQFFQNIKIYSEPCFILNVLEIKLNFGNRAISVSVLRIYFMRNRTWLNFLLRGTIWVQEVNWGAKRGI